MTYNPQKIESKWRKIWQKRKVFQVDIKKAKKPYYNLMMFPYPSAEGLHVGNVYAFTGSDIHGRFRKMQGYDVFEPMGFDAFGIHSENFAIQKKIHPKVLIQKNVNNFRRQLKNLACLFDWRYEVDTTKPNYYIWTQWLFLQLFKLGLAYRKKAPVDWCPSCRTVLADEQVIGGKCERCGREVIQKELEQWFFKITKYAERLLKNLGKIDWSERTKITQRNWIGRSEGSIIKFKVKRKESELEIPVFTTRPDTLFGATYLVVAPEHEIISKIKNRASEGSEGGEENKVLFDCQISNIEEVEKYIEESKKKTELERTELIKEKTGKELKGIKAVNPANQEKIPIFVADYVLFSYGTGAIMAVPGHDQRDFDFAKRYNLPIREVITPQINTDRKTDLHRHERAYEGEGILINSGRFNGIESGKAKLEITKLVRGKKTVNYHLRDWLISRQRYWGPPIPIIYCQKCGIVPVPEKDLPVLLPYVKNFRPTGAGKSPLASVPNFVKTKCPKCKGPGQRETDVSDTFLDSSWYFFRYPSANLANSAFDKKLTKKWLPVDMYIGGQEHAVLHLLYARFMTMVLKDLGHIDFEEPFKKFRAHGLLTKAGAKMSKSKGNVVNPDDYCKKYGADTLRMYLMFLGPFSEGGDWQDRGIVGICRFLSKVWNLRLKTELPLPKVENKEFERLIHKTIKKVTGDIENLRYNTAISSLMILVNEMEKQNQLPAISYQLLLKLLAPFAPYITEELWSRLQSNQGLLKKSESIHNQSWPKYNPKLTKEDRITLIIQINGKVRDKIEVEADIAEEKARGLAICRQKIKNWIEDKEIKKVIFVPGKLINIVI